MDSPTEALAAAGWYAGRAVPIDDGLAALRGDGYTPWPELEAVLREHSGLRVFGPAVDGALWFDAAEAAGDTDPGWTAAYTELAATELAPVGGYGPMTIFLGRDGRFYGGYDREFGPLAEDVPGLVGTVVFHRPMRRLTMRVSS